MTCVLGLTGGIATGKSTASKFFLSNNIPVVDADKGAREVTEPGHLAYDKIIQMFGETILNEDRTINRKKLGSIVFTNKNKLDRLNSIVQQDIYLWILDKKNKYIGEKHSLIVLDIPLLFEAGYESEVDEIMVIATDRSTQIERLMERDKLSEADALSRIGSQESIESKKEKADILIDNNGTLEETYEQLKTWLGQKVC